MILAISYLFLQHYWWIIISLLASFLVFLLFVQGGQTFIFTLGKTETERTMIVNSIGRKWEFTFTTLVTFGGAFFASFPLFYSTSFGGAYWVWMIILFCFIIQAVAFEFRSKPSNFLGKKTYDIFLLINGILAPLLLGTAVGTFFTGSEFFVSDMNLSAWQTPWHGLEAVLNIQSLSLGLAVLFLSRVLGILYLMNNIDFAPLILSARKMLKINSILFLAFFLFFLIRLMFIDGFAYDMNTGIVFMETYKYFYNLLQMPVNTLILLAGVVLVLWGLFIALFKESVKGIWFSGIGTVLTVFALFIIAGFNGTSYYPSTYDLQSSLTIQNSSSSFYTLKTMAVVSILVPFVIAYIWYAWKSIDRNRITKTEMEGEAHVY
jgi:cytochrome d ubiquinol oxidase subunit II